MGQDCLESPFQEIRRALRFATNHTTLHMLTPLQDLQTLSLVVRLTTSLTPTLNEPSILASSFELLCAFDEVVSLGYKENVSLQQVRNVLEGESHEEKIQEIIARVSRRGRGCGIHAYSRYRTRKPKPRKNSNVERNNSNTNAENNSGSNAPNRPTPLAAAAAAAGTPPTRTLAWREATPPRRPSTETTPRPEPLPRHSAPPQPRHPPSRAPE